MKHLLLLNFAIFLLFACLSEQKGDSSASKCRWPESLSDSVLLEDVRRHMETRNAPDPFASETDTMYQLVGQGGWGVFDYLCSIYRDSAGYKASAAGHFSQSLGEIRFEKKVRSIGAYEWQQIRSEYQKANFWCDSLNYDDKISTDGHEYFLIGKEGSKFRVVNWDDSETGLQSMKILGKKIRDMSGFPNASGLASYSIKGDSVFADVYIDSQFEPFTQKTEIQYHEKVLPFKDGMGRITLHKRDLDSLRKVIITEYGIDGSTRRVNVTQLKRQR